jgi:hypothetical protein
VTLIQQTPVVVIAPAHPAPRVRDIVGRVAVSLAIAVVAPAVLFAADLVLFNLATAMIVALVWMTGAMTWRHATGRPLSGLLLLTAVIMVVKTSIAFATGNSFIYFVQPAIVDVTVATCFLGSLWSTRPLVARLAPDFYPMDADIAARPAICLLFRRLTLLWGLVILTKGCITLWLLVSLSTVDFVLVKGCAIISLTLTAAAATVAWSVLVGRREGLFPGHHPVEVIETFGVPVIFEA